MSIGLLSIISGGLQLIVPSYGLRLVRRYGAQSVGWFLVLAFTALGLLHLVAPFKSSGQGLADEAICAVGALVLLIGLGHVETMCTARRTEESREKDLCGRWKNRVRSETAELVKSNRELTEVNARYEERLKVLEESEARFRGLFADNPQAMFVFDLRTFRILLGNSAAMKQYGYDAEEFASLQLQHLMLPAAVAGLREYAARPFTRPEQPLRCQHRRKDQSIVDVEMISLDLKYEGLPARLVLISDVGTQVRRENDVRNVARLETVGQVAGGFSHHFNNLLAIIEGSASLLSSAPAPAKAPEYLKNISTAVSRGATLTKQLMIVGGHRLVNPAPVDLNGHLQNMNRMMRRLVGDQIAIQTVYSAGLPPALMDSQAMEQVMVNLVLNARDAVGEKGTITISTATVRRSDAPVVSNTSEFIRITVRDNGVGMPAEVQARLFEPFFTTKDIGRAAGLGLAVVYGTIRQHGGWVEVSSEVGQGTEFRIFLQCASAKAVVKTAPQQTATIATVLLVEPDDRARGTARCVLNWNGYRVVEADGSATAMMLWESQATHVDLVLVDAGQSGGITGLELVKRLRQTKSNVKVVYTSAAPMDGGALEACKCVTKPYRSEALLQAIQATLGDGVEN